MISSTAPTVTTRVRGARWAASYRLGWRPATRRGVQVGLGWLWLVDALLQLQPFMFTADFARQMLASAGAGQPAWVAGPIDVVARLVAQHPVPADAGFALIQFALGIGFLCPRLVRVAVVGSLFWSAGIWWFGEGLGGLASGQASLVTGAPGAVLLYAVLAVAAWPIRKDRPPGQDHGPGQARVAVSGWFPASWAVLWIGGAVLQLVGGRASAAALRDQIDRTDGLPAWLGQAHHLARAALGQAGSAPLYVLVAVMALVGLAGLGDRPWRQAAAAVGALVATIFWVLGQNIGQLYSGMATDPNSGPLIVLMALALAGNTAANRQPDNTRRSQQRGTKTPLTPIRYGWRNESPKTHGSPTRTESPKPREADDMSISKKSLVLLITVPLALTGCAAAYSSASHSTATTSMAGSSSSSSDMTMAPGQSMAPGMTMAPGQSMPSTGPSPATAASAPNPASPPKSASMICGPETATSVATLTGRHNPPPTKATWAGHLYTCTYRLPTGSLVLSVKDSPDVAVARAYFNGSRRASGRTQSLTGLAGLGLPAYENNTGTVVFLKDNMTLKVDASGLPDRVGPQGTKRSDLAYAVATDVLACWTGR